VYQEYIIPHEASRYPLRHPVPPGNGAPDPQPVRDREVHPKLPLDPGHLRTFDIDNGLAPVRQRWNNPLGRGIPEGF